MGLPTGDFLNIRISGAVPSDTWSIGFWFKMSGSSGTPSPSDMNTAATSLLSGFNTQFWSNASNGWKPRCSTGTTLSGAKSYWYHDDNLVSAGAAAIASVAGTGASPQPNYTSQVVTLLTDTPGRSTRGRVYLPRTGESPVAGTGLWASLSAALTNLAGIFNSSTGAQSTGYFFGGTWVGDFVVVSRTHGLATSITSLRMDNKPDTQHGRENKLTASVFDTATIS